jgi:hypothetical protein
LDRRKCAEGYQKGPEIESKRRGVGHARPQRDDDLARAVERQNLRPWAR